MNSQCSNGETKCIRQQLEAYMREHAPSRLSDVDALLRSGIPEKEFWQHIEKKYLKERTDTARKRRRLTAFYQQYVPTDVGKVQALLERGVEEAVLFDALYKKYKVPLEGQLYGTTAQETRRRELTAFFEKRAGEDPSLQQEAAIEAAMDVDLPIDELLHQLCTQRTLGAEAHLASDSVVAEQYGNEQQAGVVEEQTRNQKKKRRGDEEHKKRALQQRLTDFYSTHCPDDVEGKVRYAMSLDVDETVLFASLHRRYNLDADGNPLPPASTWSRHMVDEASVASSAAVTVMAPEKETLRQRLIAFYERHNPVNLEVKLQRALALDVDEDELFRALYRQYHLDERGEPITRTVMTGGSIVTGEVEVYAHDLPSSDDCGKSQNHIDTGCDTNSEQTSQVADNGKMHHHCAPKFIVEDGLKPDAESPPRLFASEKERKQVEESVLPTVASRKHDPFLFSRHTLRFEGSGWKDVCSEKLRESFLRDFSACSGNFTKGKTVYAVVQVEVSEVRVSFFVPCEDLSGAQALDEILSAALFPSAWGLQPQPQPQQPQQPQPQQQHMCELEAEKNEDKGNDSLCVVVHCLLERIKYTIIQQALDAQRSLFVRALEVDLLFHAAQCGATHLAMGSQMTLRSDKGLELYSEVHFPTKMQAEEYVCAVLEDSAVYCREARKVYSLLGGDPYDVAVAVVSPLPAGSSELSSSTASATGRERKLVCRESQLLAWEKALQEWQNKLHEMEASLMHDRAAVKAGAMSTKNKGGSGNNGGVGGDGSTHAIRTESVSVEERAARLVSDVKTRLKRY